MNDSRANLPDDTAFSPSPRIRRGGEASTGEGRGEGKSRGAKDFPSPKQAKSDECSSHPTIQNPPLLTTSWDDGHPLDFKIAELLSKYGLTGTFYIPRSAPAGVMSRGHLRDLSSSFEIGAHTLHHVFLTEVHRETAEFEITASKSFIEEATGKPCPCFCPPAGKYSPEHLDMIRSAGFAALRTVEFMSLDFPRPENGLLIMPTTLQARPHSPLSYLKNFAKRKAVRNLWLYILHSRHPRWDQKVRHLLQTTLTRGGVFHLWGHSWEIQQFRHWDRLEYVFRLMSEIRYQAPCLTNWQVCQRVLAQSPAAPPQAATSLRA